MILDMNEQQFGAGQFPPSFPADDVPGSQPKETVRLRGSNATTVDLTGEVDDEENF